MNADPSEERVLIWAPKGRDASLVQQLLARNDIVGESIRGVDVLCSEILRPAGCVVTSEDELTPAAQLRLRATLDRQPPWSDFPIVVLGPETSAPRFHHLPVDLGNVTALDRPVSARSLLGAVRQALRGRRRQYEARRAIRQRDQFLAMLGHELRNPLGAILFATDLMEVEHRQGGDTTHHSTIQRQARHLSRLVDDLLDASRLTTGKLQLHPQPLEVGALVDCCFQSAEALARGANIELVRGSIESCWVNGDAVRLEQVIGNLLTNAIKYTEPGSQVVVSVASAAGSCELRVRDHGLGIAPDRLEKIFELFEQTEAALDRSRGGLGIGLTLVRTLVEFHGGTVQARSDGLGTGSEFIVRLPLIDAPAATVQPSPRPKEPARRGVRVVLVEDNADIRETSRAILELLGCQVREAADGPSGLRCILEVKPDLALIDVGLPGLNGYEVAQEVRRESREHIPLVAMTGYGQLEDQARALKAGFDLHLTKPVTFESLEALVIGGPQSLRQTAIRA